MAARWPSDSPSRTGVTFNALIISNPALRIVLPIPPHKLKLGKLLQKYAALDHAEERIPG